MQAKYPASAYRGVRAGIPDWLIGIPYVRYLKWAVELLELRPGDSAYGVACGPGCNIGRLVRAVGSRGVVTAVEDNPHLLACARRRVERAGWRNVRLLASLDPAQAPPCGRDHYRPQPAHGVAAARPARSGLGPSSGRGSSFRHGGALHDAGRAAGRPSGQVRARAAWPSWRLALLDRERALAASQGAFRRQHVGRIQARLRVHYLRQEGLAHQRAW